MPVAAHGISLVALLFAAATTGLSYVSAVYSEALKDRLGLTQDDIDTVSMFVGAAGIFSVFPGRIADSLGSRRAIAFGGGVQALALTGTFFVARGSYPKAVGPLASLCALNLLQWVGVATTAAASFAALSRLQLRGVGTGGFTVTSTCECGDEHVSQGKGPLSSRELETRDELSCPTTYEWEISEFGNCRL